MNISERPDEIYPSKENIAKLYEPEAFYVHGDNPAMKKFMEIAKANFAGGKQRDYRTFIIDKRNRFTYARNWDDFLLYDLKLYSMPRVLYAFSVISLGTLAACRMGRVYLPVGEHGIKDFRHTQMYQVFGLLGTVGAIALPSVSIYLWWKTAKYTFHHCYWRVFHGDVNQYMLLEENHNGDYYFSDSFMTSDEDFPDMARAEMSSRPLEKPEWHSS